MNKIINNILNYTFLPPIKLIILILCLVPIIWLSLAGDEYRSDYLMDSILDLKFK